MYVNRIILTVFVFALFWLPAVSQTCTTLGQTPSTAFPVCGTTKFQQQTVPLCSTHNIIVPGCTNTTYIDYNPFWYKFTCFEAGTLGFLVTPNNINDDYDWQLFDITGRNSDDVFTDSSLVVTGNWAGTYGVTGARNGGANVIECASDPHAKENSFAAMPKLIKNHTYLLMISHYTQTQSGYSLSFSGGTASITDTTTPNLKSITTNCEGNGLILRMNKKMKCSSLAPDGSDFTINATGITIVSAGAPGCSNGFDMDSVVLTLSGDLPSGKYTVTIKEGTDANTLLDNCDNALHAGASLAIIVNPKQPTPFDSIAPVNCAPQTIELIFSKPILCNSIADDGSDFSISGNHPVAITSAYGSCANGVSSSIFLQLSQPVTLAGTYTITTKNGGDGNTIIDECGEVTPANESVSFTVKDTVSAAFTALLLYGCKEDTVAVSHDGNNGVNSWLWTFSDGIKRTKENNNVMYNSYGKKNIQLIVSNGFCSDTATSSVNLDNELKASFIMPAIACPNDAVTITDTGTGNIISYNWSFGNGNFYSGKNPPQQRYFQANNAINYPVQLIVENNLHCTDTMTKNLQVVYTCFIAVPSAFTPNGDGINDYLYPLNAYKADALLFTVYNRLGQIVFQTKDWTKKWDGRLNGQPQPTGTYVWMLQYIHHDTKQFYSLHGTTVLIR